MNCEGGAIDVEFKPLKKEELLDGGKEASTWVLYMSFDKFLLAVESCDLSQAVKSIIRVSSFPKLSGWVAELFFLSLNN